MTLTDLRRFMKAIPFRPFRVTIANGEEFDVKHPDMLMATPTIVYLYRPLVQGKSDEYEDIAHVSMDHVLKVEYLTDAAAAPVDKSTV